MYRIVELPHTVWAPSLDAQASRQLAGELEAGKVIHLPHLAFRLEPGEERFLGTRWLSGTHKSVSYEPQRAVETGGLRGAQGSLDELKALAAMIGRFRDGALALINALFPDYRPHLRIAPTSFRPGNVEDHKLSWRKDDTLLHVDAFPSRPSRGERILRIFNNANPSGRARTWKVGDLFEATAHEFLPRVSAPLPGSLPLLRALRITKSRRSRYDHTMLRMHDRMKQDAGYQTRASHLAIPFPPGATWVCFSDQVAHAAISGQFMLEQTLHLPVDAMYFPERSPLRTLERLAQRRLT